MRVVIVAEHASAQFGGEAFIPFNYFRLLRARLVDVRLVVHSRTATELAQRFPEDQDRLYFVKDSDLQVKLSQVSHPSRLVQVTTGFINHLVTQLSQRRMVRDLVKLHGIDVVHEPIPVSPKSPSLLWNIGAPVVIGPLNGGMEFPEAFRHDGLTGRFVLVALRKLANLVNFLIPGKRRAAIVLVANRRTREALPRGIKGSVMDLVENGVDLSIWRRKSERLPASSTVRFVFVGRLVDWKAVDVLLEATHRVRNRVPISLEIIGDGPMRYAWETLADSLGLRDIVRFSGFMPQERCARRLEECDVFLLPSLFECGGAVVLEAMAMELPVIATSWGGPADYLDPSCGILVRPDSRESLIAGFATAMKMLAESEELRHGMGRAGQERVRRLFDWERKIDQILRIYQLAIETKSQVPKML
jgi:glycosyltransferase involved in cell wall biosynthesis